MTIQERAPVESGSKEKKDQVKPKSFKEYIQYLGPATIVTMVVVGPATMSTMLRGGAILGPGMGWIILFSAFTMWFMCVLSNKTTCLTGKTPLQLLGDQLGKPLVIIGGLCWIIPQFFIVAIQGIGISQTGAAITGLPPLVVVWPLCFLACIVFYSGSFTWLKKIAGAFLSILLLISLIFAVRLLAGPELSLGQVLGGLFIPRWPDNPQTAMLFAGAVGGAGSWGILAYHGYAVKNAGNAKASMLWVTNMDSFVLGFLLFGIFSLAVFWSAAGVFHPQGMQPKTAAEAAKLFVPFLGKWSYFFFYAGFLGALFTTLAGTNILFLTCLFAMLHYFKVGGEDAFNPVMENRRFKIGLWISMFVVAGLGSIPGKKEILPTFIWSLSLVTVFTAPFLGIWIYLTNSKKIVGNMRNHWVFNACLVIMFFCIAYLSVKALPGLFRNPFSW